MKHFKLAIWIILFFASCKQPSEKSNIKEESFTHSPKYTNLYDTLVKEYGRENALLSIYFLTQCLTDYDRIIKHSDNICSISEELMNYATTPIENNLNKCITIDTLKRLHKWCKANKKLHSVDITSDDGVSFEEILYNMNQGKIFFTPFLKNKSQYFGSLDFNQSCKLYYNVVEYLAKASESENDSFFREYFNVYEKIKL